MKRQLLRRKQLVRMLSRWKSNQSCTEKIAYLCPGQGSQFVGMFGNVSSDVDFSHLGFDAPLHDYLNKILRISNTGPQDTLNK